MFAPVVALVPTAPEKQMHCMQIQSALQERPASIANNGTALFAVGGVAIVLVLIIFHRDRMTRAAAGAAVGAFALWLAALLVFVFARDAFDDAAHLTAASAMFLCIIAVACINAWETTPHSRLVNYRNAYIAIAVGMVATVAATAIAALAGGWSHLTIAVEVALIALFAAFWAVQTIELWDYGLRPGARVGAGWSDPEEILKTA
jgi:FtsH-binding integral membrane protein